MADSVLYSVIFACVSGFLIPSWGSRGGLGLRWVMKWSFVVPFALTMIVVLTGPVENFPQGILGSLFFGVFSSIVSVFYYFFDCNMIEWENERKERKAREEQSRKDD